MRKRFIIANQDTTQKQADEITKYVKNLGLAWWHWIDGVWLVVDGVGSLTAGQIRDEIARISPKANCLVFEFGVGVDTWSGRGPNDPESSMFEWLHNQW